jgi:periplasmic divalent cation tolerance protein
MIALTTVADEATADRVGRMLLQERLVGCVNSLPVQSSYWWKGAIEHAQERLLIMKTAEDLRDRLERRVLELSSYEVAEFVSFPAAASPAYLTWLLESCPPQPSS